jgi:hypothetical protein
MKSVVLSAVTAVASMIALAAPANAEIAFFGAEAKLIAPLAITANQDLSFGTLAPSPGKVASVTVGPIAGGEFNDVQVVYNTVRPALFTVSGEANASVFIDPYNSEGSSAATGFQITGPGGATLDVTDLQTSIGPLGAGRYFNIDASGSQQIGLGATLTIPANSAPGVYTGSFRIVALYP